jgi:hypothetical protein
VEAPSQTLSQLPASQPLPLAEPLSAPASLSDSLGGGSLQGSLRDGASEAAGAGSGRSASEAIAFSLSDGDSDDDDNEGATGRGRGRGRAAAGAKGDAGTKVAAAAAAAAAAKSPAKQAKQVKRASSTENATDAAADAEAASTAAEAPLGHSPKRPRRSGSGPGVGPGAGAGAEAAEVANAGADVDAAAPTLAAPAAPAAAAPAAGAAAAGEWECGTCTLRNKPKAARCAACKERRPRAAAAGAAAGAVADIVGAATSHAVKPASASHTDLPSSDSLSGVSAAASIEAPAAVVPAPAAVPAASAGVPMSDTDAKADAGTGAGVDVDANASTAAVPVLTAAEAAAAAAAAAAVPGSLLSAYRGPMPSPPYPFIFMQSCVPGQFEADLRTLLSLGAFPADVTVLQDAPEPGPKVPAEEPHTHLLVGYSKYTIKSIFALARGAFLLRPAWLRDSLAARRWLPEASYGYDDFRRAADVRLARAANAARLRERRLPEHLSFSQANAVFGPSAPLSLSLPMSGSLSGSVPDADAGTAASAAASSSAVAPAVAEAEGAGGPLSTAAVAAALAAAEGPCPVHLHPTALNLGGALFGHVVFVADNERAERLGVPMPADPAMVVSRGAAEALCRAAGARFASDADLAHHIALAAAAGAGSDSAGGATEARVCLVAASMATATAVIDEVIGQRLPRRELSQTTDVPIATYGWLYASIIHRGDVNYCDHMAV